MQNELAVFWVPKEIWIGTPANFVELEQARLAVIAAKAAVAANG